MVPRLDWAEQDENIAEARAVSETCEMQCLKNPMIRASAGEPGVVHLGVRTALGEFGVTRSCVEADSRGSCRIRGLSCLLYNRCDTALTAPLERQIGCSF
jgi:hypothetical protein